MHNIAQELQKKYISVDNLSMNFWKSWLKCNSKLRLKVQNIKWKNPKPKRGCSYNPTQEEQLANVLTHGLLIIPAIIATSTLFERSQTTSQYLVSWVYGGSLTMLFIVSTFFHCSCYSTQYNGLKRILHRCDRAMIYVFIASSYFPWLQLANESQSKVLFCLEWTVWLMAAIGISYQQVFHERYKCLETIFYIIMGLGPALVILYSGLEFNGMTELKLGGLIYILGICFFKSDGLIPMAHAIWHLFVVLAAAFHYYAILKNLYPVDDYQIKTVQ